MLDEEDLEKNPESSETAEPIFTSDIPEGTKLKRRVFRNPDDKIAGGVLSGFAAYFDTDPLWWRLIFVIVFFLSIGSPMLLYLVLWIIIPEARTRSEKLQMKGEAITLESLKRTVEEETEHIRKKAAGLTDDTAAEKLRTGVQEIFHFVETAFRFIIKAFGKIFGVIFMLSGASLTIAMIIGSIFGTTSIGSDNSTDRHMFDTMFGWFPASQTDANLMQYGALMLFLSMSIGAFIIGLQLLSRQFQPIRKYRIGLILLATGIIGGIMLAIGGSRTAMDYRQQEVVSNRTAIGSNSDTLTLTMNETNLFTRLSSNRGFDSHGSFRVSDNTIYSKEIRIDVQRVDSLQEIEIKTEIYAQGKTNLDAARRARNIKYTFNADSTGRLMFEPFFTYSLKDRYRGQQIDITIYLPVGKSIYLSPGTEGYINDIKNLTDTWDREMVGHTWKMTAQGLSCPDFPKEENR